MKLEIQQFKNIANEYLTKLGFAEKDADKITDHLFEAELCGKSSHGISRLLYLRKKVEDSTINLDSKPSEIVKESANTILLDGKKQTGLVVVSELLDHCIRKMKKADIVVGGVTNTSPLSGMIRYFARKATKEDFIFLAFNNSTWAIAPYGSYKGLWGTNPITIGMPSQDKPVILDMASSKMTIGDVLNFKSMGKKLPKNMAFDESGEITTDPESGYNGGLLPIAGHKGSGLAMMIELLAGALTDSKLGKRKQNGWGSLFILVRPDIFRGLDEYKRDVSEMINELKALPKREGFEEIYYPGEMSELAREENVKRGYVDINKELIAKIQAYLEPVG